MASDPPKVLISYSHDSPEHAQHVLELANRLRVDGIDCTIDQYVVAPAEGWPRWMDKQIRDSDFVIMVCTEIYYQRVMGEEEPGRGLGVRWEGHLIYQAIYSAESMNTTFIPVLFDTGSHAHIPAPVQSTTFYFAQTEAGYEELYRRLTDQRRAIKPELGKLRSLPPAERKSEGAVGREVALSNLPERNPFFTGREQVLEQLQEALAASGRATLSGLGGVGKTQTAVEYAHQHLKEYDYIFWVSAASREGLLSGYATIAGLLKLGEFDAKDQTVAVEAVKRWLTSRSGWLLILDNADDLAMAREFIPSGKNGHVLFTTRSQAAGALAQRVEVQKMGAEEGALFLLRRSKGIRDDSPLDVADETAAPTISNELGGLPLALDQAGAYIQESSCGLLGYLNLYRKHAPDLLQIRGALTSDHPPVATTWVLSFDNIEKANPAAAELLRFCAFLHPDGIPEEVFSEGAPELGPVLEPVRSNGLALNNAILEILKYSLLRRDSNTQTLEIHRLVQAVLKQGMDEATQRLWAERAVRTINRIFPSAEFSNWSVCERLLAQVHACAELIIQWGFEFLEAARLLNNAGFYLCERGRYAGAEPLYQRALMIREKALGADHPDVAASLNELGILYYGQGRYTKAEPLYQQALEIRETAFGTEHPEVAASLNGLAMLNYDQAQYSKAEPLYQRSLVIREKALGPEHPDVAATLRGLALLYRDQGRYAKAEPLYQRALEIWQEALGPVHPDVALGLNGLAGLYKDLGQYAKAEPLYQRALAIREKALGPEHPFVAITLNGLAGLYVRQGQYAKAESLYESALAIHERALGRAHSFVATSLNGLAWLYMRQGRYENARSLYEQGLTIWEKAWGPEHPAMAQSLYNLAELYRTQGQYAKAEPLFKRALAIREKASGPDHPWVASSLNGLAGLYRDQGRYAEAEPLQTRALAIQEKALDPDDPDVAISLENYALCLRAMDHSQEAETLEARARAIRDNNARLGIPVMNPGDSRPHSAPELRGGFSTG